VKPVIALNLRAITRFQKNDYLFHYHPLGSKGPFRERQDPL
jgi:hypothetical protein